MNEIQIAINKYPFKSFDKVKAYIDEKFPEHPVTDNEIKSMLSNKVKDHRIKRKNMLPFMIKIFSKTFNTWFHDIMILNKKHYHVFIGTNNRYVVINDLSNKSSKVILESLKKFVEKYKPSKLTSDQEPAFMEQNVLDYLKDNNVIVHTIPDENHSALGIIDRFIRTLRDMIEDNPKTSIERLVDTYNNSFHRSIECTPKQMFENKDKEQSYIDKCIIDKNKQLQNKNFEIPIGKYVRYLLPSNKLSKKRTNWSVDKYKICGKNGNYYILMAKDGTVINKPRYQLIIADNNCEFAETIVGKNTGVIKRVIEHMPKNKVKVAFEMPDNSEYIDVIPESYLRDRFNKAGN